MARILIQQILFCLTLVLGVSRNCESAVAEFSPVHPASGTIHRWVSLPGVLAPFQQVNLMARVPGALKSVTADRGDHIASGQVLAVIEAPELEADLLKAEAEKEAADLEVKRLREARAKSPDLVLPQTVDNAEGRFAMAKAVLARCIATLDFAQIRAPFAGVVAARTVDVGAYVSPGSGALFKVVDAARLRCQIPVTELETPLVKIGIPVRVSVDALPGRFFETVVSRVSGVLETSTRTMLVEADLENTRGELLPGWSVTGRIAVEQHDGVLVVPVGALVMEKTNAFVFKFVEGKAVKTPVKIGFNDGVNVEVSGLKPEDILLVVGASPVADGQEVKLKTGAAK